MICCEVNYCQYLSSTLCLISVFQHVILTCDSTFDDCITVWSTYGITCEGNRRIVVVLEINNNNNISICLSVTLRYRDQHYMRVVMLNDY